MSEPQEKQELPSDVAGDAPPAVETTAGEKADDNSGGRDLSKANPLTQAAKGAAPGQCLCVPQHPADFHVCLHVCSVL
jgi:hypothetical protein